MPRNKILKKKKPTPVSAPVSQKAPPGGQYGKDLAKAKTSPAPISKPTSPAPVKNPVSQKAPPGGQYGKDIQQAGIADRAKSNVPTTQIGRTSYPEGSTSLPPTKVTMPQPQTQSSAQSLQIGGGSKDLKNNINYLQNGISSVKDGIKNYLTGEGFQKDIDIVTAGIEPYLMTYGYGTFSKASSMFKTSQALAKLNGANTIGMTIQETLANSPGFLSTAATNPAVVKIAEKAASAFIHPAAALSATFWIASTSLGGKAFSGFIKEETLQSTGFLMSRGFDYGIETGDWSVFEEGSAMVREVASDTVGLSKLLEYLPFYNTIDATNDYVDYQNKSLPLWDKMAENAKLKQDEGFTEDQINTKNREEERLQQKLATDYYNAERKKLFDYEQQARLTAQLETDERNRKLRLEEAEFWANEREKQREKEAEDRKAIAEFWLAYKKMTQKYQEESRPSKLNFGIL